MGNRDSTWKKHIVGIYKENKKVTFSPSEPYF